MGAMCSLYKEEGLALGFAELECGWCVVYGCDQSEPHTERSTCPKTSELLLLAIGNYESRLEAKPKIACQIQPIRSCHLVFFSTGRLRIHCITLPWIRPPHQLKAGSGATLHTSRPGILLMSGGEHSLNFSFFILLVNQYG